MTTYSFRSHQNDIACGHTKDVTVNINATSNDHGMIPEIPRPHQEKYANEYTSNDLLCWPMGSGKSKGALLALIKFVQRSSLNKGIIIVPQTHLASGFNSLHMRDANGIEHIFNMPNCNNFAQEDDKKLDKLIEKLLIPNIYMMEFRIFICTTNLFTSLYKRLKKQKKLKLFNKHFRWCIDEAHHICNSDMGNVEQNNVLGEAILEGIKRKVQLTLMSATPFRNQLTMFTDKNWELFTDHVVLPAEHIANMKELKHVSQYTEMHTDQPWERMKLYWENDLKTNGRIRRSMVYIPHTLSIQSEYGISREAFEQRMFDVIKGLIGKNTKTIENYLGIKGLIQYTNGTKSLIVVDFFKKPNEELLEYIADSKHVDIIVSMKRGTEGFNYNPLERMFIIHQRSSLTDMVQMTGRIYRDYPGKDKAEIIQLIRWDSKRDFADIMREQFAAMTFALYYKEYYYPTFAHLYKDNPKKAAKRDINKVFDLDDGNLDKALTELGKEIYRIEKDIGRKLTKKDFNDKIVPVVGNLIEEYGSTKEYDVDSIAKIMWNRFEKSVTELKLVTDRVKRENATTDHIEMSVDNGLDNDINYVERFGIVIQSALKNLNGKFDIFNDYIKDRDKETALLMAHEIARWIKYENAGKLPSKCGSSTEKQYVRWIWSRRSAKRNDGYNRYNWYNEIDDIFNSYGLYNIFDISIINKTWYSTVEEVSKAVQKLGIKSYDEYCKRYKEDDRLPSNPYSYYSLKNIDIILGVKNVRKCTLSVVEIKKRVKKISQDNNIIFTGRSWNEFAKNNLDLIYKLELPIDMIGIATRYNIPLCELFGSNNSKTLNIEYRKIFIFLVKNNITNESLYNNIKNKPNKFPKSHSMITKKYPFIFERVRITINKRKVI